MKCDKCHRDIPEGTSAHGVTPGTVDDEGFWADESQWLVFCSECWVEITKSIWPSVNGG